MPTKNDLPELRKLVRKNLEQMDEFNSKKDYEKIDFKNESFPVYIYEDIINENFSSLYNSLIVPEDEIIIKDDQISIIFSYPFSKEITLKFKNKDGFKRLDLLRCILEGYEKIYADIEKGNGDYEIWGHLLDELIIEQIFYNSKTRTVKLIIGS